jgi:hypothetical protein
MNNKLTTKELIKKLQMCDPDAYIMIEDGYNLRYAVRIEQEEAVALSEDEVDLLSNYLDLSHMESTYDLEDYGTLDFFSVVSICS